MKNSKVIILDAIINLILGLLLVLFTKKIVSLVGVPNSELNFYPNILGAVLFGIGIALLIEYFRKPDGLVGLGSGGANAINLCGGIVLAAWLILGKLALPLNGQIFLWGLVVILVGISCVELFVYSKNCNYSATEPQRTRRKNQIKFRATFSIML